MRKITIALSVILFIFSCKKEDNVTPTNTNDGSVEYREFHSEANKDIIIVTNVEELMATVNSTKTGNKVVVIKDGVYEVTDRLYLTGDNLIYRSESGNRDGVIIKGKGANGSIGWIFGISGQNFGIRDLSIGEVYYHGIQIHGENNPDSVHIKNVRFFDIREQMIKISYDKNKPENHSDFGIVENCLFEYTAGESFQYYCGGVDGHHCEGWIIYNNVFRNIDSPDNNLSEGAVHFWTNSSDNIVDNNIIYNCDRGIMLGLDNSPHTGGLIKNNFIVSNTDVGIYLCYASDIKVYNNTIFITGNYPNAIEYRFEETVNNKIYNNLCNKLITARENASADLSNNYTDAAEDWFNNISIGDLHLSSSKTEILNQGIDLEEVTTDIDGETRNSSKFDIGADEFGD